MTSGFWRVANISNQAGYQWTATTQLSLEQSQIYVIFSRPLVKAYKIMRSWKYFQDTEIGHLETFPLLIKKWKETNQAKVPVPFPTEFLNLARNSIIYNLFWSNQGQVFFFFFDTLVSMRFKPLPSCILITVMLFPKPQPSNHATIWRTKQAITGSGSKQEQDPHTFKNCTQVEFSN